LLRDQEKAGHEDEINKLRRNAVSVEPTMDAVLSALRGVVG
jgi:hypothetical protein